jgi:hypothetical protein
MTFSGQKQAGRAAAQRGAQLQQLGEFEAQQIERNALTEIAVSQRGAAEEKRQAGLAASRALAVAAASGGGASDPTVMKIISDITGIGSYRSSVVLYEGEERARQMRVAAVARRMEGAAGLQGGQAAQKAYNTLAYGNLFTGAGEIGMSMYRRRDLQPDTTPTLTQKYGGSEGPNQDAGIPGFQPYA